MACCFCTQIKAKGGKYDLYILSMVVFLLFLLFPWMDMGDMLCIRVKRSLGEQGIYERSFPSNLWLWSNYRADLYTAIQDECSSCFLYGNDQRNHTGICNWRGNGEAVPCQILGLQQSEIESERTYLSYVVSGLGRLLCSFNHAWA